MANAAKAHVTEADVANASTAHVDTFARDHLPPRELWPEFIFARPELHYPVRLNCVSHFLDRWVEQGRGNEPCILSPHVSYTYRELQQLVNRIANVLVSKVGLVTGGRVLLRSANNPMMVAIYLAVLKAGGIVVATMPLLRAKELAYPIQKAEVALALCDGKLADEMEKAKCIAPSLKRILYWGTNEPGSLEAMISEVSPEFSAVDTASDDICLIAFTSGTTGDPKGTMHFHRDMLAVCDGYARNVLRASRQDRFIRGGDDAAFGHGGMGQQCGFNIRTGDIVTSGNDHVVGSRLVPKVTVVIHYIRVAGDVPAPLNVFALPVVGKIAAAGRAAHCQPPHRASGQFVALVVDDFGLVTRNGFSGRTWTNLILGGADENMQ